MKQKEQTMKQKLFIGFILCSLLLCTVSCEKVKHQLKADPDDTLISISVDDVDPVDTTRSGTVFIGKADDKFGNDDFEINSTSITEDILEISVSYSGGCKEHKFTLITSEEFRESDPVQLAVSLAHNAMGDTCEAYPTEEYQFDLTPIKTRYQEAYQVDTGTIVLQLKDYPQALNYTF